MPSYALLSIGLSLAKTSDWLMKSGRDMSLAYVMCFFYREQYIQGHIIVQASKTQNSEMWPCYIILQTLLPFLGLEVSPSLAFSPSCVGRR